MLDDIRNNYLRKIEQWLSDNYIVRHILGIGVATEEAYDPKPSRATPGIRIIRKSSTIISWSVLDLIFLPDRVKMFPPDRTAGSQSLQARIWWVKSTPLAEILLAHPDFDRLFRDVLLAQVSNSQERLDAKLARILGTHSQVACALV